MQGRSSFGLACLLLGASVIAAEAKSPFAVRELFQVPFGAADEMLGAGREAAGLVIPSEFSMDASGRFYIYDIVKHRIARYSSDGYYEAQFRYPPTARQILARPDSRDNLWLLISDPARGVYCGVYNLHGKRLRDAVFSQFNRFRLHVDDNRVLHAILSSDRSPRVQTFLFDEETLRLKNESIAPPPENHHAVRREDQVYFIDAVPGAAPGGQAPINRITDAARRTVAEIRGAVIYVTAAGEIYARTVPCQLEVYDVEGSFKGKLRLVGLRSSCNSIRFDEAGNIYQLDGIPSGSESPSRSTAGDLEDRRYNAEMKGMRLLYYQRQ